MPLATTRVEITGLEGPVCRLPYAFSPLEGSHRAHSPPAKNAATRVPRFCPGKPVRDSSPRFLLCLGHAGALPVSVHHKHAVHKEPRLSHPYPLGKCGTPGNPDTTQEPLLRRASLLTLSCRFPDPIPSEHLVIPVSLPVFSLTQSFF